MNFELGLYPVITKNFCSGRDSLFVLSEVIKGGVRIVQLREKNISKKELFELALKYREITTQQNVKLIINDHLDIALAVKADGIHLGQNDLPCKIARQISKELIIGVSTHTQEEIDQAQNDGATYVNVGPIFKTNTKQNVVPLGSSFIKEVLIDIPFSVMGGIKENHIDELIGLGVKNIAMVTEITQAPIIKDKVKSLVSRFYR